MLVLYCGYSCRLYHISFNWRQVDGGTVSDTRDGDSAIYFTLKEIIGILKGKNYDCIREFF
jgi:vacuolar-type H+-ATPase subunit E/Vma4